MKVLKLNSIFKMGDNSLLKLTAAAPNLEHLEINKCEGLTEYSIKSVINQNE